MLSKVYSFLDWDGWSGERVVLRPDGTIPVARLYIDNLAEQELARLFYVTNIFAFEGTGKENRERWQCGAEFFGGTKVTPDVEIILLAEEVLRRLGISNVRLQLSHAGLVRALLKKLKLSPTEEAKIANRILEGDWQALARAKAASPEIKRIMATLLSLKGKSSSFLHNMKASFPKASRDFKSSLDDLINVTTLLDSLGCNYKIDISAIHGFEYYTGVCFQFLAAGQNIGGGGRYDNLVPLMDGKDVPACGFALYVDHIMKLLPPEKGEKAQSEILVKGKDLTIEIAETCFTLAESLRDAGHNVALAFAGRDESDYRWIILVSGKEPSSFVITDCIRGQQRDAASTAEIIEIVSKG
jgi:histidyl-tRNA synthetase